MKVSKDSKYQTHEKSIKLTKNPNDRTGALKGGPFGEIFLWEKVSQCRKKLKGGPFSFARYCMLRGKTGKTFLVQFSRRNGSI